VIDEITPTPPPAAPEPGGPPPVPWTARDVWWGLGVMVLSLAVVAAVLLIARPVLDAGLIVSLGELVMAVPVVVFVFLKRRAGLKELGFRGFGWRALQLVALLLVASYIVNGLYALILAYFGLEVQGELTAIVAELDSPWWFVVGAAVVAPLVEEAFFRGFMFAGLRGRYGWGRAALVSSALFALLHGQLTAFLPIFLLGLLLAYLYHATRSLWPGILFHFINNGVAIAVIFIATRPGLERFLP